MQTLKEVILQEQLGRAGEKQPKPRTYTLLYRYCGYLLNLQFIGTTLEQKYD